MTNAISNPNIFCDSVYSTGFLLEAILYFAY